jgi:hypothetical protein
MERYLPDSVQYCSLARVHKITKYFNMVEASQKGFVTHVVMCDRRSALKLPIVERASWPKPDVFVQNTKGLAFENDPFNGDVSAIPHSKLTAWYEAT